MQQLKLDAEGVIVTIELLDQVAVVMKDTYGRRWEMSRGEARTLAEALIAVAGPDGS